MKNTMKVEDSILSAAVFACYVIATTGCGITTYAMVMLSKMAYGKLGQGIHLTASHL